MGAIKLNFETYGTDTLPPLMLLHGFMGSLKDWDKIIECLSQSYFCIAVDLPWHGKSPALKPEEDAFEQTADLLKKCVRGLQFQKSAVLGYSMGGRLAMYAATRYPDVFNALLVESASPGIEGIINVKAQQKRDRIIIERLRNVDFDYFLDSWYEQPLFESLVKHPRFQALKQSRLKNNPARLALAVANLGAAAQPSLWNKLERYRGDMLYLAGRLDKKYCSMANVLERRRPRTSIELVRKCGHNIHFEKSAVFCKTVQDFLEQK